MWDTRSIIVRFRRQRGNTCLPGEQKNLKKIKEEAVKNDQKNAAKQAQDIQNINNRLQSVVEKETIMTSQTNSDLTTSIQTSGTPSAIFSEKNSQEARVGIYANLNLR